MANKKHKETYSEYMSKSVIDNPSMTAAFAMGALYEAIEFDNGGKESIRGIDINTVQKALIKQEALLAKGDLSSLEAMLFSQVHMLNTISAIMTTSMAKAKYADQLEVYGRLALKSQNQARQSINTLAEIKGIKKTTFINQTNNANNQQINNGAGENLDNSANEKVLNNVVTRSKAKRTSANTQDETLALPENTGRTSAISTKCSKTRHEVGSMAGVRKADGSTIKAGEKSQKAG